MTPIVQIIVISVPSLLIFLTSYLMLRNFIQNERERRNQEVITANQKTITPIRLQAYERVTLLLERISPESLIMRTNKKGMNSDELHTALLANIRAEFEHNLSQQIYMTNKTWEAVKSARSNMVKLINTSAEKVEAQSPSINLSQKILEAIMELDKTPSMAALEILKEEMNTFL